MQELCLLLEAEDFRRFYDLDKIKKNPETEAIYFNIPKDNFTRRQYKMPNLYSYVELCYYTVDHKSNFIDSFIENKFSGSRFFNQLDFNFKFTKKIEERLLFGGNTILSLDLSNFYHTLYTHSIPWVIQGKNESKRNRNGGFANDLDSIIQHSQYGETHGIPTGNLITRIIAELYMCCIDKIMLQRGYRYYRYVDDIKFAYQTETEKEMFLTDFSKICRTFNLVINDKKTEINHFPYLNNRQKTSIFSFFEECNSSTNAKKWREKISDFWDFCLTEESEGNKGAIKCAFSVVLNTIKFKKLEKELVNKIFTHIESGTKKNLFEKLLDISFKDSKLSIKFITFTEELIYFGCDKIKILDIFSRYMEENKKNYFNRFNKSLANNWNQEVYQILLYLVVFEKDNFFSNDVIQNIFELYRDYELDDYSLCLLLILWLKNSWSQVDLLMIVDKMLDEKHHEYPDNNSRMSEQLWLFRYFLYYLINNEVIEKASVQFYFQKYSIPVVSGDVDVFQSEICQNYAMKVTPASKKTKVTEFYNELLKKNISLIRVFTERGKFIYL